MTLREQDSQRMCTIKTAIRFKGWAIAANGRKDYDDCEAITNEMIKANGLQRNLKLFAVWEKTVYTLKLNYGINASNQSDYDGVSNKSMDVTFGEIYRLPAPTRKGYTFDGWYLTERSGIRTRITNGFAENKKNGNAEVGAGAQSWHYSDVDATVEVTAGWNATTYKIVLKEYKTIAFDTNTALSEKEVGQMDKFGRIFRDWKLEDTYLCNRFTGGASETFTRIDAGTYIELNDVPSEHIMLNGRSAVVQVTAADEQYGQPKDYVRNQSDYPVENGVLILDFRGESQKIDSSLHIRSNVQKVTLLGGNKTFSNFNLVVDPRDTALSLCFDRISFTACENCYAIDAYGDYALTVEYQGTVTITGGKGSDGSNGLTVADRYGTASTGATGQNAAQGWYIYGNLDGGRGGTGGSGLRGDDGKNGFDGLSGKAALRVKTVPEFTQYDNGKLTLRGGSGGTGGNGSDGGRGQQGGNGGTGGRGGKSTYWYLFVCYTDYGKGGRGGDGGTGGAGGNGGKGGKGGDAAAAIEYSAGSAPSQTGRLTFYAGTCGAGGRGGMGADGGAGGERGIGGKGGNGDGWNILSGFTGGLINGIVEACRNGGNGAGDLGDRGSAGARGQDGLTGANGAAVSAVVRK